MQRYLLRINAPFILRAALAAIWLTFLGSPSHAADVARDIREGRQDESADFTGYIEIGARVSAGQVPVVGVDDVEISLTIGGHLRVKRFFLDFLSESYNRGQAGYNLYAGPTWSFDAVATGSPDGIDTTLSNELDGLRDRSGAVESGLRVTGFLGPFIAQFEALRDISGKHNGGIVTTTLARQYLWQNWNLHWLLGARYQSSQTTDFLYGVTRDEASARFPEYNAGAGVTYVTELGATLPLHSSFVFRGTGRYWSLPSSISDSPFIEENNYFEISGSLVFVY